MSLEIDGHGTSFRVQRVLLVKRSNPLWLLGMRGRVEMVGGWFTFQSPPGKGTAIRAQIPFQNDARVPEILVVTAARPES
jgi:signal transduction histidine kinase